MWSSTLHRPWLGPEKMNPSKSRSVQLGVLFVLASALVDVWLACCLQRQVVLNEASFVFAVYLGLIFGQLAIGGGWLVYGPRHALARLPAGLMLVWLLAWPIAHAGQTLTARPFFVVGIYVAIVSLCLAGFRVARYTWISVGDNSLARLNDSAHLQFSLASVAAWMTGICLFLGLAGQTGVDSSELTNAVVYLSPFVFTALVCWSSLRCGGTLTWRIMLLLVCPVVAGLVGTGVLPGVHGTVTFAIAATVELSYIGLACMLLYSAGYRLFVRPSQGHEFHRPGPVRLG